MPKKKIGFIGCGNIAGAIIDGAVSKGYIKYKDLYLFEPDILKLGPYSAKGANICKTSMELTSLCDYVFLAVKPQIYDSVLYEIAPYAADTCFISVAAGITVNYVKKLLGFDAPVIRVMPNTPLVCGNGATALVKVSPVKDEEYLFIRDLFECSGVCVDVTEEFINTVTAISGSAPAYILRFAKNLIDFSVESGMSENDAKKLVLTTVYGSALMAANSELDIETLIKNVTSPNGTTFAGLTSMDSTGFDESLKLCLEATRRRADELTK